MRYKEKQSVILGVSETEEKEIGAEGLFQAMMTDNLLWINVGHQVTDPGNSENTKQDKCQKKKLERSQIKKEKPYL